MQQQCKLLVCLLIDILHVLISWLVWCFEHMNHYKVSRVCKTVEQLHANCFL